MNWKIVLALVLLFIVVIFTVQNYEVVEIKFLFWALKASRALVLFLTLLIGIFTGWIFSLLRRHR